MEPTTLAGFVCLGAALVVSLVRDERQPVVDDLPFLHIEAGEVVQ